MKFQDFLNESKNVSQSRNKVQYLADIKRFLDKHLITMKGDKRYWDYVTNYSHTFELAISDDQNILITLEVKPGDIIKRYITIEFILIIDDKTEPDVFENMNFTLKSNEFNFFDKEIDKIMKKIKTTLDSAIKDL